ncbi:MAG: hypothetical protein DRN30_03230 [Thermoplasmata archaeon]|nr:MAG: hypothetical protein DRN30_03230 [Thermoplasmata archaeon]
MKEDEPIFSQEEVLKVFRITRMFLDGHTKISVGRNLAMTQDELGSLRRKIERWEDFKEKLKEE